MSAGQLFFEQSWSMWMSLAALLTTCLPARDSSGTKTRMSSSMAAMQPVPAAVMAREKFSQWSTWVLVSPTQYMIWGWVARTW